MNESASTLLQLWRNTMRAKICMEQYDILWNIMEYRQSGLSDRQWCLEHDINLRTFYNLVRCFCKQTCKFLESVEKDRF